MAAEDRAPSDSVITWTNYHTHYRTCNGVERERKRGSERERASVCRTKIAPSGPGHDLRRAPGILLTSKRTGDRRGDEGVTDGPVAKRVIHM